MISSLSVFVRSGCFLWMLLLPGWVLAHPYHTSVTELTFSDNGKQLQFALRMPGHDLEKALCDAHSCNIEQQAKLELYAADYIVKTVLSQNWGSKVSIVGVDYQPAESWIYFQFPLKRQTSFCFDYRVLMDSEPGQINTIRFRSENTDRTRQLTLHDSEFCVD